MVLVDLQWEGGVWVTGWEGPTVARRTSPRTRRERSGEKRGRRESPPSLERSSCRGAAAGCEGVIQRRQGATRAAEAVMRTVGGGSRGGVRVGYAGSPASLRPTPVLTEACPCSGGLPRRVASAHQSTPRPRRPCRYQRGGACRMCISSTPSDSQGESLRVPLAQPPSGKSRH